MQLQGNEPILSQEKGHLSRKIIKQTNSDDLRQRYQLKKGQEEAQEKVRKDNKRTKIYNAKIKLNRAESELQSAEMLFSEKRNKAYSNYMSQKSKCDACLSTLSTLQQRHYTTSNGFAQADFSTIENASDGERQLQKSIASHALDYSSSGHSADFARMAMFSNDNFYGASVFDKSNEVFDQLILFIYISNLD